MLLGHAVVTRLLLDNRFSTPFETVFKSAHGVALRNLHYNADLVQGKDFGGTAGAHYMQAALRYGGRFFREFDPKGSGEMARSPHRWLIVSALYGLLTPTESIRRYSCNTLDDDAITGIWKGKGLLTSLLLHYSAAAQYRARHRPLGRSVIRRVVRLDEGATERCSRA